MTHGKAATKHARIPQVNWNAQESTENNLIREKFHGFELQGFYVHASDD